MVITPKPSWNNELVSMLSLLEFITPLYTALLVEQNLICFHSPTLLTGALNQTVVFACDGSSSTLKTTHTHTVNRHLSAQLMRLILSCPCFTLSHVIAHRLIRGKHDPWKSEDLAPLKECVYMTVSNKQTGYDDVNVTS